MSKKIISLMLAMALSASMVAVAAASVSADTDENGNYVPSEGTETYRYYFYMPQNWENEFTDTAGAYWWEGTDACPTWQDMYKIAETEDKNIFCVDVPQDVTKLIFNNHVDGGEDADAPQYTKAAQTSDITCVNEDEGEAWGYWPEEDNDLYPEGIRNFDNMIYVIDEARIEINPLNQKQTCAGQWYYYYGNGEYGYTPVKGDGAVYNTEYCSFEQALADKEAGVKPESTVPTEETEATEETKETEATEESKETEATEESKPVETAALTVNATSNIFPAAKAEYNNTTKEVTVTYYLGTDRDLVNLEWYMSYDPSVLSFDNMKNLDASGRKFGLMPQIPVGDVYNFDTPGKINANASNLSLYQINSEEPFVQVTFDVVGEPENVETTIDLQVRVLTTGELDFTTMQVNQQTMNSFVVDFVLKDEAPLTFKNTTLTESTFVPNTESTETTAEPDPTNTTAEPDPTNTTAKPDPTEDTQATDATSATGASVNGGSTADTPSNGNNSSNANNNGTVKTGDASLAVVILTLLVSATGVMFVIRKREML